MSARRAVLRAATWVLALAITAGAGLVVLRLHTPSPLDRSSREIVDDALPRLRYLKGAVDDGGAERMQQYFPEGYFFTWVLYGLTWTEVGRRDPGRRTEALREARRALVRLDSPAGRGTFDARLSPPYGVFYTGWTTWLRAGVARLAGGGEPSEVGRLSIDVLALGNAFTASLDTAGSPYLPAYPDQAWPVDSVVAIAAIALGAETIGYDAEPLIQRWLAGTEQRRDPATGLLPHRVDPRTGAPVEGARGSSQAMLLRFLHEVAPIRARRDWDAFWRQFRSTMPGVPGIREYPRGTAGPADVDSGPLIFGLSASASVVAIGDAVIYGDRPAARDLTGIAEAVGGAVYWRGERGYLAGQVPVGDAFLAWSLVSTSWLQPVHRPISNETGFWRVPWYLALFWLVVPAWLLILAESRSRRGRS